MARRYVPRVPFNIMIIKKVEGYIYANWKSFYMFLSRGILSYGYSEQISDIILYYTTLFDDNDVMISRDE